MTEPLHRDAQFGDVATQKMLTDTAGGTLIAVKRPSYHHISRQFGQLRLLMGQAAAHLGSKTVLLLAHAVQI